MKNIIAFLVLTYCINPAHGQIHRLVVTSDSIRTVKLDEITLSSIRKIPQQRLVNFFRSNNAATLEDIMSRLPELSLVRRGPYGMEPAIRSFTGGQINVLVDGMRIHGACTDKMDPATIYIEPINLENLQVQTATSGFMNGSAIGGTINMKMAEPDYDSTDKITGIISSGYQTAAKSIYESAKLNYSSGKWAFRASGTFRKNRDYRSGGGSKIDFSQFKKVNYSFSAKFQQNQYTYLKADVLLDDGWNIGYPALPMDVGYAAARILSFSINRENGLKHLYKWQTKIYANEIRHFMDDTKRPFVAMHMDMPGISKTYGIYSEGELRINQKQSLLLRADGSSTFLKASMTMYQAGQLPMYMLTWPDNRKDQYGVSASWLLQMDTTMKLQVTGRTDFIISSLVSQEAKEQVSIFGYEAPNRKDFLKNLSGQLSKKLNSKIKITAGLAYSERVPTASELYGFYLFNSNDGYDYIGNPELKSEKSIQGDLSVMYNLGTTSIQVTCYHAKILHYITSLVEPSISTMTIGAHGVKSFDNIPYATVSGLEVSGILKPCASIEVISTLRYTSGKDNNNEPLPSIAPLKNITSIRYQPKRFSVQLETEAALPQNEVNIKAGEDKTPGYILLHSRFGYNTSIFKNSVTLQAGIENMLDKKNHEHLDWSNISRQERNIPVQNKVTI